MVVTAPGPAFLAAAATIAPDLARDRQGPSDCASMVVVAVAHAASPLVAHFAVSTRAVPAGFLPQSARAGVWEGCRYEPRRRRPCAPHGLPAARSGGDEAEGWGGR